MRERHSSSWRHVAWATVLLAACSPVWAADHTATATTTTITDPTNYVIFRHMDSFPEELIPGEIEWNAGGTWGLEIGPRFPAMLGWPIAGRRWPITVGTTINFAYTNATVVAVDDDGATGANAPAFWNYYANTRDLAINSAEHFLTEAWTQRSSRLLEGEWRVPVDDPDPNVAQQWLLVRQRYTVLRDTVRVEYFVKNDTQGPWDPTLVPPGYNPPGIPLAVGIRTVFDAGFGEIQSIVPFDETDGQPVYVTPPYPPVSADFLFADTPGAGAPAMPEVWQAFQTGNAIGNTGVVVKGTMAGQDVDDRQFADSVAGAPDQLHIGRLATVAADDWQFDFVPSPVSFLAQDWAVAVRWDVPDLPDLDVGETRRYVTYYGRGEATSDFPPVAGVGHYVLALESPLGLEAVQGDDPSTVAVEDYFYTVDALDPAADGIIPLQCFANNVDQVQVDVGSISVSLPPGSGLKFVDAAGVDIPGAGSSLTVPIGLLPAGTEGSGDLYIRAPAGITPGIYQIRCAGPGKMVERPLSIPAIPEFGVDQVDVVRNLTMMSVPYDFVDRDAENILGTLQGPPVDPTVSALGLARYDPDYLGYRYWPNPFILLIFPGQGFWVYNPPDAVPSIDLLTLPAPPDRSEVSAPTGYALLCKKGWNQVGTPFTAASMWNQTRFQVGAAPPVDFDTAVSQGLIMPVLFWYDVSIGDYGFNSDPDDVALNPWVGYWILCYRDLNVIFMPPQPVVGRQVRPAARAEPRARQVGPDDWRVELVASVPGITRAGRTLGVAPGAADGFDGSDIMDPPPPEGPEGYLAMFFPHSDWGQMAGRYRWDFRSAITEQKVWDLIVQTNRANQEVTLSWPNLREIPKDYGIVLHDVDADVSRSMRTTSVYRYNSGAAGGERHFQVTVSPQRVGVPQIAGFQFVPARGLGGRGDVIFQVNMDCLVDINIRNIAGRRIKTLTRQQHFATGQHSVHWDGRNDWGAVVPNGNYLGEIIARTEQGERAARVARFVVLR